MKTSARGVARNLFWGGIKVFREEAYKTLILNSITVLKSSFPQKVYLDWFWEGILAPPPSLRPLPPPGRHLKFCRKCVVLRNLVKIILEPRTNYILQEEYFQYDDGRLWLNRNALTVNRQNEDGITNRPRPISILLRSTPQSTDHA